MNWFDRLYRRRTCGQTADHTLHQAFERGCALHDAGRDWEALRLFTRVRASTFQHPGLAKNLAWSHLRMGNYGDAERLMRESLEVSPDDWTIHYGLGEALRTRDPLAAKDAFNGALKFSPGNIDCLLNLSACDVGLGKGSSAEGYARRAIDISPESCPAWTNLGVALLLQDRLNDASDAFAEAERLRRVAFDESDDDPPEIVNRGIALRLAGHAEEAIEYYEVHLPNHPSVGAHGHYALALLTAGRFTEGWDQFEFRWMEYPLAAQRARYDRPAWNGQDLRGKTILLRCEQGAGDVFQFIRFAPVVKARGATVLLELRPGLGKIAETFPGVDSVFEHGKPSRDFDFYVDLMGLPRVLQTSLATIPAQVPYLTAPADRSARWRDRFAVVGDLKVGLVWGGDPRHARDRQRSIPLDAFAPLARIEGTRWYSLQKGRTAELKESPLNGAVVDLDKEIFEYADTAAIIENLDLVVAADTSVAHLAGALGKPAWVLLPFCADWRWMEEREESPWYPTMRLFRQTIAGDWSTVLGDMGAAMIDLTLGRGASESSSTTTAPLLSALHDQPVLTHGKREVRGIARARRTRVGMMQYLPESDDASRSIEHYGEYLQPHVDMLQDLVGSGSVVVEVGSGIGVHSIAIASFVGADGQVLALDRSRILRRILRHNIAANDVTGVSIMPAGSVHASLDQLQFEELDVLKANTGTNVPDLLDGGWKTLARHRPILLLAQDSREAVEAQARRAIGVGYHCWCVETPLFNPGNFNRREDDIFGGRQSFALLAFAEEREMRAPAHSRVRVTPITR
jgi:tetratricopeptide (TPR) repeat protein/precorrin-6B methylase 2